MTQLHAPFVNVHQPVRDNSPKANPSDIPHGECGATVRHDRSGFLQKGQKGQKVPDLPADASTPPDAQSRVAVEDKRGVQQKDAQRTPTLAACAFQTSSHPVRVAGTAVRVGELVN